MKNLKQAFTLIEILVVIAIAGIFLAFIIYTVSGAKAKAQDNLVEQGTTKITAGAIDYYEQNKTYGDSGGGNGEGGNNGATPVTVSYENNPDHPASYATDGNPDTYYMACPSGNYGNDEDWSGRLQGQPVSDYNNGWLQYDLGSTQKVDKIRLDFGLSEWDTPGKIDYPGSGPSEYQVAVSNDGVNWQNIVTKSGVHAFSFEMSPTSVTGRYIRLNYTMVNDGTGWCLAVKEFKVDASPTVVTPPVVDKCPCTDSQWCDYSSSDAGVCQDKRESGKGCSSNEQCLNSNCKVVGQTNSIPPSYIRQCGVNKCDGVICIQWRACDPATGMCSIDTRPTATLGSNPIITCTTDKDCSVNQDNKECQKNPSEPGTNNNICIPYTNLIPGEEIVAPLPPPKIYPRRPLNASSTL
ncbi:MAG: discoidin domain-containing protein [bacterium]